MEGQVQLETKIIAGVVGEGQYNRVSFLEPGDFETYGKVWEIVARVNGDYALILKGGHFEIAGMGVLATYTGLERLGLLLLEYRYRKLLDRLTQKLLEASTDELEVGILLRFHEESQSLDILEVIDDAPDYLENQISPKALSRFQDLRNYVNNRAKTIRACL